MQPDLKISIYINSLAGGGAERVVSYLAPYLHKKQKVYVVLNNATIAYTLPEDLPIIYLSSKKEKQNGLLKLLNLPFLAYRYAKFLKKEQITHSFSLLTRPCYVNIMARWFTNHNYKLIISERNYPSMQYGGSSAQARINRRLVKWLYPKADLVISNAKASAQDLVENFGVNPSKTATIYNPIAIDKISAIEPKTDFFNTAYVNAVSVGRLVKEKNHSFLLDAIEPFKNMRLYIFGEGELRGSLEEKIKDLGLENRVYLMGFGSNPFQYLKAADFFLFGSLNEGFPNVLLEAMCCGLPIISTNCKSGPDEMLELKEAKTDDIMFTDYGILTPIEDVCLMQKAIHYVLDSPDYLVKRKPFLKRRIIDFEKETILKLYEKTILN